MEVEHMAHTKARELKIDYAVMAKNVDLEKFVDKVGVERILEIFGPRRSRNT